MIAKNTDREIYRQPSSERYPEGYEPTVFVTKNGYIGFQHGGKCSVHSIEDWIKLSWGEDE